MQSNNYAYAGVDYSVSLSNEQPGFPWRLDIPELDYVEWFVESQDCHEVAEQQILPW